MNEFFNTYIEARVGTRLGNSQMFVMPVQPQNNSSNPNNSQDQSLLDYSNPAYNQLSVKNSQIHDKILYLQIFNSLDYEGKQLLSRLEPTGKLYSRNSNDGSSTLQNLYKILKTPRLDFFDSRNIVKETLKVMDNPYLTTQNFGDIPDKIEPSLIEAENYRLKKKIDAAKSNGTYDPELEADPLPLTRKEINFSKGHTCPAASIEFNLADRKPAEFARYVEGLTSPSKSVKTKVKYQDLSADRAEAVAALMYQQTEYKPLDWQTIEVTVRPDDNAYIRADVQEDARIPNSRSMIDVILQSAFMQLGSRGTYNSLTDNRSKDTGGGKGLNQFEIAFVESIVDSKSRKVPILYMELNDEATKLLKYNFPPEKTKKHILESLDSGNNIIVGFLTTMDNKGNLLTPDGHEILLTGYKHDKHNNLWFRYNDTDDGNYFAPSWIKADNLIPVLHHANIPDTVLAKNS